MRMTRRQIAWTAAGLSMVSILGIVAALLFNTDWNRAKPWLNTRVSEATGRPFSINGDLLLTWDQAAVPESGWRGWLPWPHLIARNVVIGNPDGINTEPNLAELKQVSFSLNPLALFGKKIVIPRLQFDAPTLTLERLKDGRNNWTFAASSPSAWQLELQQLVLNKGNVRLVDAVRRADINAAIDTIPADPRYGIAWQLTGTVDGERVSGQGKAGGVLSLQTEAAPYPIEATLRMGKTTARVTGNLTRPSDLAALDMRLNLAGANLAHLYALTGIVLPETPAYATEGHLVGTLNKQGGDWRYAQFSGTVGTSDISGTLAYESTQPRPLLSGKVTSKVLQLMDLAPLIGAGAATGKPGQDTVDATPAGKVLPTAPFKTDRWTSIDADVQFTGQKIMRDDALPIDNMTTHVRLADGVVSLKPLNFGVAGGTVETDILLDGRNKTVKAEMKIAARHLKLKQLFPTFQPMQASLGEINGDARLSATGNSIASLLGGANGEIKAVINQGTISKLLLEQIGLNIGNVLLTTLIGDEQVKLHCLASDFAVTRGVMQARTFVIDTDASITTVTGQINLAQEQLALTINPRSKGLRIMSLRAPLYVTGSFKTPDVSIDKGVLALKAGSAVVLAVLAPVAALIPLANLGQQEDTACAALLTEANIKPVAPAPGTVYRDKRSPQ